MSEFSQNASAFNCGLIAFKRLIYFECQLRGFYGINRTLQERVTCDLAEVKQRLVKAILNPFQILVYF